VKKNIGIPEQLLDFLEEHKGESFSAAELSKYLEFVKDVVIKKLYKLLKHHEIKSEQISYRVARKIYNNNNIKRGMNLYFLE